MTSPLENLCGPGQPLRREPPDAKEIAGLERSGLRRLADGEKQANSLERRFDLAYNAAHALSLAALRRSGYRAATDTSCFKSYRTRSGSPRRSGECSPGVMTFEIAGSTKAICTSMSAWLRT